MTQTWVLVGIFILRSGFLGAIYIAKTECRGRGRIQSIKAFASLFMVMVFRGYGFGWAYAFTGQIKSGGQFRFRKRSITIWVY